MAGFAPEEGENALELSERFPGSTLGDTLWPVQLSDGSTDLYIRQEEYHQQFAEDVPAELSALMAVGQRPVRDVALNEASGPPAWKSIPSWFVFGELDKNIPLEAHRFIAEQAQAREVVEIEGASHAVGVSRTPRRWPTSSSARSRPSSSATSASPLFLRAEVNERSARAIHRSA